MRASFMKKIIQFTVKENRRLNPDTFRLKLQAEDLPEIYPGQFVNVKIEGAPSVFLRRPISVHDVDSEQGFLYLLVKIAGAGTEKLSHIQEGEKLDIILPLGNSFAIPNKRGKFLLIGGGVGIAPLLYLAKVLKTKGFSPTVLIGMRSASDIVLQEEFEKYATVYYTTEDGSFGEKGYPTQHSILQTHFNRIFCCGPEPMMKAVAKYAYGKNIDCQVSLENKMACGVGACLCCVTDTQEGHKCVCTEGPVFHINDLKWQI